MTGMKHLPGQRLLSCLGKKSLALPVQPVVDWGPARPHPQAHLAQM